MGAVGRLLLVLGTVSDVHGYVSFQSAIPNGGSVRRNGQPWPGVGHVEASGGPSPKNLFGDDFIDAGHAWTVALCRLDSDGDGQTNGMELGDPECTWVRGGAPNRTTHISHPGYSDSTTSWVPGQTASPTPAPAPPPGSPAGQVGAAADLPLGGAGEADVRLSFRAVGTDSVELTVSLDRRAWLGFGISAGGTVSMNGNGQGSDVVVCTEGEVRRYWVTSKSVPSDYLVVPESACTQEGASTTLTFTRKIAAENNRQRALLPGTAQQTIFAYGEDGEASLAFHQGRFGGQAVDFGTGAVEELGRKSAPVQLFLHLALMSVAWGGLLPFGAVAANRLRDVPGAEKGAWFRLHVGIQSAGWVLQLLGFGAALWYCQFHARHLASAHSWLGLFITAIGVLQPVNAALRPHPTQPKSRGRIAFEVVHKGLGWLALLTGVINILLGILTAARNGHGPAVLGTAGALAAPLLTSVVVFFVFAAVRPNNSISRWLVAAGPRENQAA